jgi:glycerol 2-dehydrogenase (NADP+)
MESPFPGIRTGLIKTTDKVNFNDAWADIEKILETGKVRAIGVSNFSIKTCVLFHFSFDSLQRSLLLLVSLEKLLTTAKVTPAVNQVEYASSLFP